MGNTPTKMQTVVLRMPEINLNLHDELRKIQYKSWQTGTHFTFGTRIFSEYRGEKMTIQQEIVIELSKVKRKHILNELTLLYSFT